MNEKIVIESQDRIEQYEQIARRFFSDVLNCNLDECLITDDSYLNDFSGCGIDNEPNDAWSNLKEFNEAWDAWILNKLKMKYGLEYLTTAMPLLTLFRDLEEVLSRKLH